MSAKSNGAHTPGPWSVVEHSWSDTSVVSTSHTVCRMSIYDEATEDTEQELQARDSANARLIAAAPELLEALRAFDQWNYEVKSARVNGESVYDYNDLQHMRAEAERLTDAALAKATGGAK